MIDIHPDISIARTPPADFYRDPRWLSAQKEKVFVPSFQMVLPSMIQNTQLTLLPGFLDERLLVSEDAGARVLLSQICPHRGNQLTGLRCGYHGRRFAKDGRCVAAPGFEQLLPEDDLPRAVCDTWAGLEFVSLRPHTSFAGWIGSAQEKLGFLPLERLVWDPSGVRSYRVAAHWALYVENYLEGLHIPFVHPVLARALDLDSYEVELLPMGSLQCSLGKGGPSLPGGFAACYLWMFPNLMLNFYPWGLSVNIVVPEAPDRTRIDYARYIWAPEYLGQGAGGDLDTVELEDDAVVESVQRGLAGVLYGRGRYADPAERGVHHFHRLLAQVLGEGRFIS